MRWQFLLFFTTLLICHVRSQVATGQSDRTQQELALLGWTAGVRMAYCQQTPVHDLVEPFKESIARMLNRHCRNAAACRIKKSVTFTKYQVVILDGFPRREHRTISFRFFVVLPHDAVPLEKRPDKPLLSSLILSGSVYFYLLAQLYWIFFIGAEMLESQMAELTHGLGWQILSYEKYPRFDSTTTFFNRSLIPIAIVVGLCMIFLAYWVSSLTSGSSLYADGWLVRGSSGGKNAALRRTMEIIEEQKYRFALYDSQKGAGAVHAGATAPPRAVVLYKSNARVQEVQAPPKSLATSHAGHTIEASRALPIYPAPERRVEAHRAVAIPMPSNEGVTKIGANDMAAVAKGTTGTKKDELRKQQRYPQQQAHYQFAQDLTEPRTTIGISPKARTKESSSSSSISNEPIKKQKLRYDQTENGNIGEQEMAEMADCVPEIVVMHARDSMDTLDTLDTTISPGGGRKLSATQAGKKSRRFSIAEEFKRRKSFFGSPGKEQRGAERTRGNQQDRQKRWKASSIALSKFSVVGSAGRQK